MAVKDLERIISELATACWAKEARIVPSTRRAFLAHVHVVHRDTLSTVDLSPEVIDELDHHTTTEPAGAASPAYPYLVRDPDRERASLAALTSGINRPPATSDTSAEDGTTGTSPAPDPTIPPPRTAPGTTASPADTASTGKACTGKPTTARTSKQEDTDSAVTGYGGLDVSDYV